MLISFNPQAVETQVTLPSGVTGLVLDAFAGQRVPWATPLRVALEPYQVRVLTVP